MEGYVSSLSYINPSITIMIYYEASTPVAYDIRNTAPLYFLYACMYRKPSTAILVIASLSPDSDNLSLDY
jgi:hypothetical protein